MTTAAAQRPSTVAARRPSARRRALSWLAPSVWIVFIVGGFSGIAVLLVLHRGDAEGSARLANLEIESLLDRTETVVARVPVMQRHWWDYFRVTHGVLAASDRRILYVGVPPDELLPREEEPRTLLEISYAYDRPVSAERHRVFLGSQIGVTMHAPDGAEDFAVAGRDRERLRAVLAVLDRKQSELRAAAAAERLAADATAAASRRAIFHLVQRGESLEFIARRYGVPVDSLVAWNALPTTRITAGRRLLVKPQS